MLTAPTGRTKSFTLTMSIKTFTNNFCQQNTAGLIQTFKYISNKSLEIQSALTLLSTAWFAYMPFYSAPCYKCGVQRWQVQRYYSKLTKQATINHNHKCFIKKLSTATRAYFMQVLLAERYNKTTWNNNVFSLQALLSIQDNTTVVLVTILTESHITI